MRSLGTGVLACVFVVGLAGCGGGGGGSRSGSGSGQGGGPITPAANVTVAITSAAINASIAQGDPYSATVSGTWSATNLGSGAVYLQISDSAGTFALPAIQAAPPNGAFSYALPVAPTVASGERSGTITVKACKDTACTNAHAGTSGSVGYRLAVNSVPEWETVQGNAAHNGYVPITLDASKFAKAWEWRPPHVPPVRTIWLGMPVTGSDGVYVNAMPYYDDHDASDQLVALEEQSGATRWVKSVGTDADPAYATSAAYAGGRLYYGKGLYTFNTNNTYAGLIALQANTGSTAFSSEAIQLANGVAAPTPFGGNIYMSGAFKFPARGYASIDGTTGNPQWATPLVQTVQGRPWATPSVDSQNLYFHSACCLEILDRQSGAVVASITNPSADATYTTRSLFSPTLLGSRGNVLALALTPTAGKRLLSSFNIAGKSLEWTSALDYSGFPAVANGVIYVSRIENNHVSLHALNETTGQALWTWTPPEAEGQSTQLYNVVATRNLVFFSAADSVSQTGRLWALDIASRQPVWSYPAFGPLAISAKRMLFL
ncbi:MAG: hypothetical protein EOO11_20350, partial [Chitinophagaceae bacterium]